jgi:hypothetical protein
MRLRVSWLEGAQIGSHQRAFKGRPLRSIDRLHGAAGAVTVRRKSGLQKPALGRALLATAPRAGRPPLGDRAGRAAAGSVTEQGD